MSQAKAQIGVIGLAVMGENLILNIADRGFRVAAYNRTVAKVGAFKAGRAASYAGILGAGSLEEFVGMLERPRRVMLMVKAGAAVDEQIGQLVPLLEAGDIIVDGGNSNYEDTARRHAELEQRGLLYIGTGVSGGEEGARRGPAIMPGGSPLAWPHVQPIFEAIAAKAGPEKAPCCAWIGQGGAGHYVKMVHNGIEYGDMQIICEAYHLMRALGMSCDEMAAVFAEWNKGELDSYLIDITAKILATKDTDGEPLVDKVVDQAGQKGTGKWTVIASLDGGVPVTLIAEAVFARCISAMRESRVKAAEAFGSGARKALQVDRAQFIGDLRAALLAAKMTSYAQGFMLLASASEAHGWNLRYGEIASIWRGGCIIRSAFLGRIKEAFDQGPQLGNLLLAPWFRSVIAESEESWRRVVGAGIASGIPLPAMASALTFFDSCRCDRLPASLLQLQRDFFGAHQYQRWDRDGLCHTDWSGEGSAVSGGYTLTEGLSAEG